jgi:hypothetical protein
MVPQLPLKTLLLKNSSGLKKVSVQIKKFTKDMDLPVAIKLLRKNLYVFATWTNFEWVISIFGTLLIVVFLWAPFGLRNPDIADGWINANIVKHYTIGYILSQIFYGISARPLVYLPWKLAFILSKDSYMGVELMFALTFWGQSVILYAILRKMRFAPPALAFFIAVIFMLYPADQGNFLMSAFSRHVAVFFYLASVLLMIMASQHFSPIYILGMALTEGISALISEQGYPLMFLAPLLLLLVGNQHSQRKKSTLAALWYAVFLFAVVNYIITPKAYQSYLFAQGLSTSYIKEVFISNLLAYRRILVDGWLVALNEWKNLPGNLLLLAGILTLVVSGIVRLLMHWAGDAESETNARKHFWGLVLVALAIIGLGFFPYSVTKYRYLDFRVFYYSSVGGALITGLVCLQISKRLPYFKGLMNFALFGGVSFLILINGLAQHAQYVAQSVIQQEVLIGIAEQAPSIKPGTVIGLIIPPTYISTFNLAGFTGWPFKFDAHFEKALRWMYKQDNVQGVLCATVDACIGEIPYKNALLFNYIAVNHVDLIEEIPAEYQKTNTTEQYKPYDLIKSYTPFPEPLKRAFDVKPAPARIAPQGWLGENQTLNDRRVCNISHSGNCSLLFYSDGLLTGFTQQVDISGEADEQFELSLWAKSDKAVPDTLPIGTLTIFYKDGAQDEYSITGQLYKKWMSQKIKIKTSKSYNHLLLSLYPRTDAASIWLDEVRLVKDNSEILIDNPSFEK